MIWLTIGGGSHSCPGGLDNDRPLGKFVKPKFSSGPLWLSNSLKSFIFTWPSLRLYCRAISDYIDHFYLLFFKIIQMTPFVWNNLDISIISEIINTIENLQKYFNCYNTIINLLILPSTGYFWSFCHNLRSAIQRCINCPSICPIFREFC